MSEERIETKMDRELLETLRRRAAEERGGEYEVIEDAACLYLEHGRPIITELIERASLSPPRKKRCGSPSPSNTPTATKPVASDPEGGRCDIERVVPDDPKDDYLGALTRASGADYLVSGDPHLAGLEDEETVPVLTPRQFVDLLEGGDR